MLGEKVKLHIIYTQSNMLLSKKAYRSWLEIQNEYESYKASLGPWEVDQIVEYLAEEYPDLQPLAMEQISLFVTGEEEVWIVAFEGNQ